MVLMFLDRDTHTHIRPQMNMNIYTYMYTVLVILGAFTQFIVTFIYHKIDLRIGITVGNRIFQPT